MKSKKRNDYVSKTWDPFERRFDYTEISTDVEPEESNALIEWVKTIPFLAIAAVLICIDMGILA